MRTERYFALLLILLLAILAFRPMTSPEPVKAQDAPRACGLYFEPGVTTLRAPGGERQAFGKVAYDTCSGKVWGFPTGSSAPYPMDTTNPAPTTSHPIYLGRFAVEATQK
ncbi:MAG TPA: hypothetical protein VN577_23875 [Terriglobales bacterium]|nr:hypothetical protein [Terriglobales bacterium]